MRFDQLRDDCPCVLEEGKELRLMRVESDALLCFKARETVLKRVIGGAGNHNCGADFRFDCSFKDANHHVT